MSTSPSTAARLRGLIPLPRTIIDQGPDITLSPAFVIVSDETLRTHAERLAASLRAGTGWPWPVLPAGTRTDRPAIRLRHTPDPATPEGYHLETSPDKILVTAADPAGAGHAAQTLRQLLPPAIFARPRVPAGTWAAPAAAWTLPAVLIRDHPRFRWRGVLLDSARHFQPVAFIRKFIDLLAQHKINVLHWHLTDDQGWRIEIKKYPRLTQVGSRRRESLRGHLADDDGAGDATPVEGHYTQDDIRALVAHAAERGVHIMPEIEMPGHAQAAITAYPELGCKYGPLEVSTRLGVHSNIFNVNPSTVEFLKDVLAEVAELFPFDYVHIGGDEAVKTQWETDPVTQARMIRLGVPDEEALQGWLIGEIAAFLRTKGRKLICWDEVLDTGVSNETTIMSWRGRDKAAQAAARGNDAIMCDIKTLYFDYSQDPNPLNEPLSIGGCVSLRQTYETDPMPAGLTEDQQQHIIGVQGQLWTEYMPTTDLLEYMAFPRVCALAEVGWSDPGDKDYPFFTARLQHHLKRLDCQTVRYRPPGSPDA